MKKNILVTIAIITQLLMMRDGLCQEYIRGERVKPSYGIISNAILDKSTRLTITQALTSINNFFDKPEYLSKDRMAGEHYLIQGMVVRVVVREREDTYDFPSMAKWKMMLDAQSGDSVGNLYYSELVQKSGFDGVVEYFYITQQKNFIIADKMNRYVVMGSVFCAPSDKREAEKLVSQIVNNIKFK